MRHAFTNRPSLGRVSWMVQLVVLVLAAFLFGCRPAARSPNHEKLDATSSRTVEAGCATCIFDMPGVTGCKLAVKIDGVAYLVTGSSIDDHGDAHAATGLCNASRKAVVEGEVEDGRFVAKKIELVP